MAINLANTKAVDTADKVSSQDALLQEDNLSRHLALDCSQSFIVRAPAGSGKTELLTQRFLSLLAVVDQPEQIVALTFTRKAAAEMRARLVKHLHAAQQDLASDAPAHQQVTHHLARQVLARDSVKQWGLTQAPHRLRLMTIDALCSDLVRQLPLTSGLSQTMIADYPSELYAQATDELFADLDIDSPWQTALTVLLRHCDNRLDHLKGLCQQLLATREQWLGLMAAAQSDSISLKRLLEDNFAAVNQAGLADIDRALSIEIKHELWLRLQLAAHLAVKQAERWRIFLDYDAWPAADSQHLAFWQALAHFLLKSDGQWRKRLDTNGGFPSPSKAPDVATQLAWQHHKESMLDLLEQLSADAALQVALHNAQVAPESRYTADEWPLCQAIFELLPALLVYWRMVNEQWQQTDFTELSWCARHALGEMDRPSDLALQCDYQIRHWLIDEFQDTSVAQFDLLSRLTAGWQAKDGRSLFLVGDPLQSIYRFRQAEVSLFGQVWAAGFGHIPVCPLNLTQNFRSHAALITWFNTQLAPLFPSAMNWQVGAVPYTPVSTTMLPCLASGVTECVTLDEAMTVHDLVQQELTAGVSIAILVKARSHLPAILSALQHSGIGYRAVELTALSEQPVVADLLTCLRLLLNRDDRLAWAALLRAPWGGALSLSDWHLIVADQHRTFVWPWPEVDGVSSVASDRLVKLDTILQRVFAQRHRQSLSQCVLSLWQALHADRYWSEALAQAACEKFWQLLRSQERAADLPSLARFERVLAKTYIDEDRVAQVDVMTIHKAKGLEFDVVILPGQDRRGAADDPPLFLFDALYGPDGAKWLMAPMKAIGVQQEPRYDFLRHLQKQKRRHEAQRLFYVACTRARQRLYILREAEAS